MSERDKRPNNRNRFIIFCTFEFIIHSHSFPSLAKISGTHRQNCSKNRAATKSKIKTQQDTDLANTAHDNRQIYTIDAPLLILLGFLDEEERKFRRSTRRSFTDRSLHDWANPARKCTLRRFLGPLRFARGLR